MPWTGTQFSERHNNALHGGKANHAARIANAVLRSGAPEGESIAVANKWALHHRQEGGGLDEYDSNNPTGSRESDAELLSEGRRQGKDTDLNLTPVPEYQQTKNGRPRTLDQRPGAGWMPQQIPTQIPPRNPPDHPYMHQAAYGGGIQRRDDGGGLVADPSSPQIGGITPSAQTANPLAQNMIQRYSSLPTEKLQELSARLGGTQQGQLVQRILQQKRMMPQQQQTDPVQQSGTPNALGYRRGGAPKRADGGDMGISPSQGSPWWTRSEARGADSGSGFLHGTTPGRADSLQTTAPGGSYVLPADVVAGLGEGNSLAGARIADAIFSTGPHGTSLPRSGRGMGAPRSPPPYREQAKGGGIKLYKAGGVTSGTPVMLSHGEYVVSPEYCRALGNGDPKRGHRILDKWILAQRKKQIDKLKKLPGPVKT